MNLLCRVCQSAKVGSYASLAIIVKYTVCWTWQNYRRHHSSSENLPRQLQSVHFLQPHILNTIFNSAT